MNTKTKTELSEESVTAIRDFVSKYNGPQPAVLGEPLLSPEKEWLWGTPSVVIVRTENRILASEIVWSGAPGSHYHKRAKALENNMKEGDSTEFGVEVYLVLLHPGRDGNFAPTLLPSDHPASRVAFRKDKDGWKQTAPYRRQFKADHNY